MTTYQPSSFAELEQVMTQIVEEKTAVRVYAGNTKAVLGNLCVAEADLDVSGLAGVIDYEPEELIITAHAGTSLTQIETLLAEHGQMLAFEPPHYDQLYGQKTTGSLGGLMMANLSGSRRLSAGAARDYLLGFEGVSGRGTSFRSGSKVVKNVTGYDLSKLVCGSYGTLAIIDEMTLKTLPAPETSCSLVVKAASLSDAGSAARAALMTAYEPSAAAILPQGLHDLSKAGPVAIIRLEGVGVSVADRFDNLRGALSQFGQIEKLETKQSIALWRAVTDGGFAFAKDNQIWRISVPPSQGPKLYEALTDQGDVTGYLDWAGGLLWLSCHDPDSHQQIRDQLARHEGGHATLMRADEALRADVPVFEPVPDALGQLNKRIQQSFDPYGLLNPGRL